MTDFASVTTFLNIIKFYLCIWLVFSYLVSDTGISFIIKQHLLTILNNQPDKP